MSEVEVTTKEELIKHLLNNMATPNVRIKEQSAEDEDKYRFFIESVNKNKSINIQLPLEFAIRNEMFNLIKEERVFVESSVKFVTTFTTKRPNVDLNSIKYNERYVGNEFNYSFLDNHPGIINVDKLKDIPVDYEGLMAVPPTILEYKNLIRFNIHRILYTPKYNGKYIYPRIVISNKVIVAD
jgi:hypothetical protein